MLTQQSAFYDAAFLAIEHTVQYHLTCYSAKSTIADEAGVMMLVNEFTRSPPRV
jgi:hypothetical protein